LPQPGAVASLLRFFDRALEFVNLTLEIGQFRRVEPRIERAPEPQLFASARVPIGDLQVASDSHRVPSSATPMNGARAIAEGHVP
jgi:hypothetical protein